MTATLNPQSERSKHRETLLAYRTFLAPNAIGRILHAYERGNLASYVKDLTRGFNNLITLEKVQQDFANHGIDISTAEIQEECERNCILEPG